jgi:hypothetical protein
MYNSNNSLLNKTEQKHVILKTPFKEVSEIVVGIDNKKPVIKFIRLFIRYLTRITGYIFAAKVLGLILFSLKSRVNSRNMKYNLYLLEINKLRNEYLNCLSKNNLHEAVLKKNQWAEFVSNNSSSQISRWNSRRYLSLLSRYGYYHKKIEGCEIDIKVESKKKFYIFGPNASVMPSSKYDEYVLVLCKPIDIEVGLFDEHILFINSHYYNNVVCNDKKLKNELIKKNDKIFVSCREAILSDHFIRSKFPIGDQLASSMALGRILYNLIKTYGKFSCIIEGFDFYLDQNPYKEYYPTLTRDKHSMINEQVICSSLAHHDALYNFLFVKEIVEKLDLVDSSDFCKIINLSGKDYLDKLSKFRKFEVL